MLGGTGTNARLREAQSARSIAVSALPLGAAALLYGGVPERMGKQARWRMARAAYRGEGVLPHPAASFANDGRMGTVIWRKADVICRNIGKIIQSFVIGRNELGFVE